MFELAFGVITCSQRIASGITDQTLRSLAGAGFARPRVFVDSEPKLGHIGNWITALLDLYIRFPKAQRLIIFEDDCATVMHLREYLEHAPAPWPNGELGYWNLLTHNVNLMHTGTVNGWHRSNQCGMGSVGLMLERRTVLHLFASRRFMAMRTANNGADGLLIESLRELGYYEWVHFPSLLQHVAGPSMLGHNYGAVSSFDANYRVPRTQ